MILYRNRLLFGFVKNIIKTVFSVVYKILALFNLHYTILLVLVGIILYFTGAFERNDGVVLLIYQILIVLSVVHAIVGTVKRLLGLDKKVKKSKGAQIVNKKSDVKDDDANDYDQPRKEKPTYFRVKQSPDYVMAEYSDRYELYKKSEVGLKHVRTDYK